MIWKDSFYRISLFLQKLESYKEKKGEKAVSSIEIWKYAQKKADSDKDGEESEESERVFKKKAFFFRFSQVEPIRRAEDECEKV